MTMRVRREWNGNNWVFRNPTLHLIMILDHPGTDEAVTFGIFKQCNA